MDIARHQVVIGADTSEFDAKMASMQGRLSGIGGILGGALAGTAAAGLTAVGAGLVYAAKEASGFEKTMSGVKAVSGASAEEMKTLSDLALKLGADTSFSATEAGKGIEELVKAGVSVADVMGGAAKASLDLAAAGEISVAEAATIAANAMNQFGLKGKDVPHVADLIAGAANASAIDVHQFGYSLQAAGAVASTVGFSFDDLAQAIAVMGKNGIVGSDAGTSLKTMMLNLQPSSKGARKVMEELGIVTADGANAFFDAAGKVKSMAEVSGILQKATAGLTQQQKLAKLEIIFGSDAIRAATILAKEGAEGFAEMAESMGKVTAASVAEERLNNVRGSLEKLTGSLSTAAITVGTKFLPGIKDMIDGATNLVNDGTPLLDSFVDATIKGADTLGAQFGRVAGIWKKAADGDLRGAIDDAVTLVGDARGTFDEKFKLWSTAFVDWLIPMSTNFFTGIEKWQIAIFDWIIDPENWGKIKDMLVRDWGGAFTSWIGEGAPDKGQAVLDMLGAYLRVVTGWAIAEHVAAKLREGTASMGAAMIQGMQQGLTDKWGELAEWITENIGKKLPEWMQKLLGIHSPSTVFAEIGQNLIAGLIVGMQDKSGALLESAKGIFGALTGVGGGGGGIGMDLIRDIQRLATSIGGVEFGRAAAAISAAETGGGRFLQEIGGTDARGPFQFDPGGELINYARFLGVSKSDAGNFAMANPMHAAKWALEGYLGDALQRGLARGLTGDNLAVFGSRYGQRPREGEEFKAGEWFRRIFGYERGGVAMTPQIATLGEREPEAVLPFSLLQRAADNAAAGTVHIPIYLGGQLVEDLWVDGRERAIRRGRVPIGSAA